MRRFYLALLCLLVVFGSVSCLDEPTDVTVIVSTESELEAALANAEAGDLIEMESGNYGTPGNVSIGGQPFMRYPNNWDTNVWVRPAEGASVTVAWRSDTPNLTLAGGDMDDHATDGRYLEANIVYLQANANKNEVLLVDKLRGGYVRGADDTIWFANTIDDSDRHPNSFDDGIQISDTNGNATGNAPERTSIVANVIGPIYRTSLSHHGDCIQAFGGVGEMFIHGNELLPCASGGIQIGNGAFGDWTIEENIFWACDGDTTTPDWCPSTGGNIKGGSHGGIAFINNIFHGTSIGLNVEGPGDGYSETGSVYDNQVWPGFN